MASAVIAVDPIQDTVNLVLLIGVGIVAYLLYKTYQAGTACPSWLASVGLCTPSGMDAPSSVPGNTTVAQSVGGYDKIGTNGVTYSCTGPSGSASDMCMPVTCDANANCSSAGASVPANQTGLLGSTTW